MIRTIIGIVLLFLTSIVFLVLFVIRLKSPKEWAEMPVSHKEKIIGIGTLVAVGVVGFLLILSTGGGKSSSQPKVNIEGTGTSEAFVGKDVVWAATITNTWSKDIADLKLDTDFGVMDLESASPTATEPMSFNRAGFGPLKAGASVTITFNLLAKKTGVASGYITVLDAQEPCTTHPRTIVR